MIKQVKRLKRWVLKVSAAALLVGALIVPGTYTASAQVMGQDSIPAVVQQTTSSVVAIIGKPSESKRVWEQSRYHLAHGTGVIVRSEGYILTNAHVVKDMSNIIVVTSDGQSYPGKTTHYDEESDLALVKIDASGLTAAKFAKPTDIRVGESVMAIGTPLSFALRNSVTSGIVSGMERSIQSKYQLIQTDAAINPGNSGGALVNKKGEVIGINTLKYVEFGVDSLGFAIPVDTVQHVLDHFFKYGKVKRPYLGLELGESWEAVVGLPSASGLEVTYVDPDSPAAKAGVKQGDVLLSIDTVSTRNLVEYNEALKKYLPGQSIGLTLQSGSQTKDLDVVLGEDRSMVTTLVQDAEGTSIDADQGKTRIGDSHFGWSMKYPAGLIKFDQSESGNNIIFGDAKGEFAIHISIDEKQSKDLSPQGLLRKLTQHTGDTVLEKRYINENPQSYAKLAAKSEYGEYYEARAYQKEDNIFYLTLAVEKEENYLNGFKRSSYIDLLDTFVLSFDSADEALKDISAYQDQNTITTEYGLAFDVPSDWSKHEWGSGLNFSSDDGEKNWSVQVTSAASGDTLGQWAHRQERRFIESYADGYREVRGVKETTVGGVSAIENLYSYTMGDKWRQVHVFYIIKDKYKYELVASYPKSDSAEMEKLLTHVIESVQFSKETMNRSLGVIEDLNDLIDPNKTATFMSKKYGYSIQIPELWFSGYESEQDYGLNVFSFDGGSLTVDSDDQSSFNEAVSRIEQEHKKNAEIDANYKYTSAEEALFGTTIKTFSTQYKSRNVPYTLNEYVFDKNGIIYTVTIRINDAVKTDAQWKRLTDALNSMKFSVK